MEDTMKTYDHCFINLSPWYLRLFNIERWTVGYRVDKTKIYIFHKDHLIVKHLTDKKPYSPPGFVKKDIDPRVLTVFTAWLNYCIVNNSKFKDIDEFRQIVEKILKGNFDV
jgi:hypothetical protein